MRCPKCNENVESPDSHRSTEHPRHYTCRSVGLREQIDTLSAEVGSLRSQLASAQSRLSEYEAAIQRADARDLELSSELIEANAKLASAQAGAAATLRAVDKVCADVVPEGLATWEEAWNHLRSIRQRLIDALLANTAGSAPLEAHRREELTKFLTVWDQTIGCDRCGKAWWSENATDDHTLFHDKDCPLFGRWDVASEAFNMEYIEKSLGRRQGVSSDTREGWRDLAALYVRLHRDEQEAHFRSLYRLAEHLFGEGDRTFIEADDDKRVDVLVERTDSALADLRRMRERVETVQADEVRAREALRYVRECYGHVFRADDKRDVDAVLNAATKPAATPEPASDRRCCWCGHDESVHGKEDCRQPGLAECNCGAFVAPMPGEETRK